MYILQKNNQTFYGPNLWNQKLIESYITDEFEIEMSVSKTAPDTGTNIGNDIFVYKLSSVDKPEYNKKIQKLHGPFYTIVENMAVETYQVIDKDIDYVKSELLSKLADARWKREVAGVEVEIQNTQLRVTTQRGERDIFLQALQSGLDNQNWKMSSASGETVWLTLSPVDLQTVVNAIVTHIQEVFNWENNVSTQISQATTLTELDSIIIEEPNSQTIGE